MAFAMMLTHADSAESIDWVVDILTEFTPEKIAILVGSN
jgi:hypothetical protein